jgi:energy-coupling factor transporter ATP-binding protein EcfA2
MPNIFISYRRADSRAFVGRIFDRLSVRYGIESIFLDVDHISPGLDYRNTIDDTLQRSDVLLVVIGPRWLEVNERIHRPDDFLRLEVEAALQRDIPIIPVLVDEGRMPSPNELPETLRTFTRLNAATIHTGRDFHLDMENLIRSIDRRLGLKAPTVADDLVASAPLRRETKKTKGGREFLAGVKELTREFFRAAGRPVEDAAHDQLLGPDPIWVSSVNDPEPQDILNFSDFLAPGQRGFLVYEGALPSQTSMALDRLRVEGKSIIPINVNAASAAIADGNASVLLADLERGYESNDNLFDTRNAISDERFFFGRDKLLAQVGGALARGEHVLVTGLRKCGKTSFLNILRQHLSSHPVCFVDLQRYDRHAEDWPTELFQLILRSYDSWGRRNFNDWPATPDAKGPTTATEFEGLLNAMRNWQLSRGRSERMIVILDEAERIFPGESEIQEAQKYTRATGALRMVCQASSDQPLSIIVADLRPWLNRKNVLADGSTNPFFNFFQEVPLPLLTPYAVDELVRVIGGAIGIKNVNAAYIDELFSLSGGHPSITRMIAGASYRARLKSYELSREDIQEGLKEMADKDSLGFFFRNNLWGLMTSDEKATLLDVAKSSMLKSLRSRLRLLFGKPRGRSNSEAFANLVAQGILHDRKITIGSLRDWICHLKNSRA